jgi:hypothetical protein
VTNTRDAWRMSNGSSPHVPSPEQQLARLRDLSKREWMQQRGINLWLTETVGLANDAAKEELDDWRVYMFWVRLYGVLSDLREHWKKVIAQRHARGLETVRFESLVAATDEVRESLTEEHALCLEYRRHWVAHPVLNDFRISEGPKGIRDSRGAKLLEGRSTRIDEYDDALTRLVQSDDHKGNARDIAAAVIPALHRLCNLVQEMYRLVPIHSFHDVERE